MADDVVRRRPVASSRRKLLLERGEGEGGCLHLHGGSNQSVWPDMIGYVTGLLGGTTPWQPDLLTT